MISHKLRKLLNVLAHLHMHVEMDYGEISQETHGIKFRQLDGGLDLSINCDLQF